MGKRSKFCCIGRQEKTCKFAGVFTDGRMAGRLPGAVGGVGWDRKNQSDRGPGQEKSRFNPELCGRRAGIMRPSTGKLKGMSNFGTPGLVVPCEAIGDFHKKLDSGNDGGTAKDWRPGA